MEILNLFGTEIEIKHKINDFDNLDFIGFIDLVIQTDDLKYHIIDFKTCRLAAGMLEEKLVSKQHIS